MKSAEGLKNGSSEVLFQKLSKEASEGGYFLNPDKDFVLDLCEGLLTNEKRFGYMACPCRLASGKKDEDLDIVCPCDYRDSDIEKYGACYCGLYVSKEVAEGKKNISSIPESRRGQSRLTPTADVPSSSLPCRPRPAEGEAPLKRGRGQAGVIRHSSSYPVWRCRVCGYLCARNEPPGICPICKVGKERFERFI